MSDPVTPPRIDCYTSFTYSYLSRARILVETIRQAHPDWRIWALLVDEVPPGVDEAAALADFDHVVLARELEIPRFRSWLFKHDIVEACTAVKGQMMVHLLERGATKVIYFDPDIALFHPITEIVERLNDASIILTPHQVDANETDMAVNDNEITSLLYGIFYLGFVAVANDANGRAFAAWWAKQLYRACYDEISSGIFTDQKYCDLVPALFENVLICRDPGCNVASWNLSRRTIKYGPGGEILVNGSPLKFYHFTKIGGVGDNMTDRYAEENLEVFEVWNWYKRKIREKEVRGVPKSYWHYGHFTNGVAIIKPVRQFFRSRVDLLAFFNDPFEVTGNSFYEWLKREEPGLSVIEEKMLRAV